LNTEARTLSNILVKTLACEKEIASKVFQTAYKVGKENHSFHNFKPKVDLQELNGIDMERILHSTNVQTL
jgi:hypothetical protein